MNLMIDLTPSEKAQLAAAAKQTRLDPAELTGNSVCVPAIIYYETLRELERLNASAQIARLKAFCFAHPYRFLPLETIHLEHDFVPQWTDLLKDILRGEFA